MREFTPDFMTTLPENGVFVFGSNSEGNHGAGAALHALRLFGAIDGQSEGLQGKSYGLVSKKNWRVKKSSSLDEIQEQISKLYYVARAHPELKFYMTKIGCGLAGWSEKEIKEVFKRFDHTPENIILPEAFEFRDV